MEMSPGDNVSIKGVIEIIANDGELVPVGKGAKSVGDKFGMVNHNGIDWVGGVQVPDAPIKIDIANKFKETAFFTDQRGNGADVVGD
jgi:hypothetical protein